MLNKIQTRGTRWSTTRNILYDVKLSQCMKSVPSFSYQYWHVLFMNKKELVGDMTMSGRLGCSNHEIVKFKILKRWRNESSRAQTLDLEQIMVVHMRDRSSQMQEKIILTQWAGLVSKHKMSHVAMWNWVLEYVTILVMIHPQQNAKLFFHVLLVSGFLNLSQENIMTLLF